MKRILRPKRPMGLRRNILVIIIITMAALFVVSFSFLSNIITLNEELSERTNAAQMKDLSISLENHLNEAVLLHNAFRWDKDLLAYYSLHKRGSSISILEEHKSALQDKVALLLSTKQTFTRMMLVFPRMNTVVFSDGSSSYDVFLKIYNLTPEEFERKDAYQNGMRIISVGQQPAEETGAAEDLSRVQIYAAKINTVCYAVVVTPQLSIDTLLATQFEQKGMEVFVLTQENQLYGKCYDDKPLPTEEVISLWEKQPHTQKRNGDHYDVKYASVGGLRIVAMFQRSQLEESLYRVRLRLAGFGMGFVVLAGILFVIMDRWFYRPIENLLKMYDLAPESGGLKENEYLKISGIMDRMSASILSLERRIQEEEYSALDRTHSLFLENESREGKTPYFAVIMLVCEDAGGHYLHDKCRRFCQLINKKRPLYVICDHDATFACVMDLEDTQFPKTLISETLLSLSEEGDYMRVGVSQVHLSSEELIEPYNESRQALNSGDEGMVVEYAPEHVQSAASHFQVTNAHQTSLAWMLTGGDPNKLTGKLDEIYEANSSLNLYWQRRLSGYLLDLLLVLAENQSAARLSPVDMQEAWINSHNPDLLRQKVYERYRAVCSAMHVNDDDMSEKVKRYVEEHLSDPDLSLRSTADAVGRSYSHVSTFFNKTVGVSFSEYLQKRRIAVAMHLLAKTDDPIQKIALEVGYEVPGSFIRLFKKETGMTPGQYRDEAGHADI